MASEGGMLPPCPNSATDSIRRPLQWFAKNFVTGTGLRPRRSGFRLVTSGFMCRHHTPRRLNTQPQVGRIACPGRRTRVFTKWILLGFPHEECPGIQIRAGTDPIGAAAPGRLFVAFVAFCSAPVPSRRHAAKEQKATKATKARSPRSSLRAASWKSKKNSVSHPRVTRTAFSPPGRLGTP